MSNEIRKIISLNYKSLTPKEFNDLFSLRGFRTFKESTIQSKINEYLEIDKVKEHRYNLTKERADKDIVSYRAKALYNAAKSRAKSKNIPFSLDYEWLKSKIENGVCECTGIAFYLKPYTKREDYCKVHPFSPSIDQIIPSKGYTKDNCQIVCDQFNKMKNDNSMETTLFLAERFVNFQKNKIKVPYIKLSRLLLS